MEPLELVSITVKFSLRNVDFIHSGTCLYPAIPFGFEAKLTKGGPRPGKGRVAEWSKATDCKSVEGFLRRFESCLSQYQSISFF